MSTFAVDVSKFAQKSTMRATRVLEKLAYEGFSALVQASPVDTGRFRASWRVGVNGMDDSVAPPKDSPSDIPAGSTPTSGEYAVAAKAIMEAKFGDTIRITNNLEYGEDLEKGKSSQAPDGVLRVAFQKVSGMADAIVAAGQFSSMPGKAV